MVHKKETNAKISIPVVDAWLGPPMNSRAPESFINPGVISASSYSLLFITYSQGEGGEQLRTNAFISLRERDCHLLSFYHHAKQDGLCRATAKSEE